MSNSTLIHKFITKRPPTRNEPPAVRFIAHDNLTHPPTLLNNRWEVFAQNNLSIKHSITLMLGMKAIIHGGTGFVSLRQSLKERRLSLQDGLIAESADDIVVTIQNNSDSEVTISARESLCYIFHQN